MPAPPQDRTIAALGSRKYKGRSTTEAFLLLTSNFVLRTSGISSLDHCADAAARPEVAADYCPYWPGGSHYIFEHAIDDVLLKNSQVAVGEQVFLQRLQLQADLVGHVTDLQCPEIRQPGHGTYRSEFRDINDNFIGRKLVRPGLNGGECCVESRFGVLRSVTRPGHADIVAGDTACLPTSCRLLLFQRLRLFQWQFLGAAIAHLERRLAASLEKFSVEFRAE